MKNTSILFYSHSWTNHDERIEQLTSGLDRRVESFKAECSPRIFVELMSLTEFILDNITLASMTYEVIIKDNHCYEISTRMCFDHSKLNINFSLDKPEIYTCAYESSNKSTYPFIITGPSSMDRLRELGNWATHFIVNETVHKQRLDDLNEYTKIVSKIELLKTLYTEADSHDFDLSMAQEHIQMFINIRDEVVATLETAHNSLPYF